MFKMSTDGKVILLQAFQPLQLLSQFVSMALYLLIIPLYCRKLILKSPDIVSCNFSSLLYLLRFFFGSGYLFFECEDVVVEQLDLLGV